MEIYSRGGGGGVVGLFFTKLTDLPATFKAAGHLATADCNLSTTQLATLALMTPHIASTINI